MRLLSTLKRIQANYYGGDYFINYLRKKGVKVGDGCRIFSDISTSESYLVEIGNNTTIAGNVQFITHDASIQKIVPGVTDLFGKVRIGNNCFIGNGATIMYGVCLPANTIVAAGSVVTKSINVERKILGGNPAKIISDIDTFAEKSRKHAVNIKGITPEQKKLLIEDDKILVKR